MFGWNIFVTNLTVGALFGYSSMNSRVSLKVPSSQAVSSGLEQREGTAAQVGARVRDGGERRTQR